MLVLKRKEGQWVEITHRSGDVMRIRVCRIEAGRPGHLNLAFEDSARNFEIERPDRKTPRGTRPATVPIAVPVASAEVEFASATMTSLIPLGQVF